MSSGFYLFDAFSGNLVLAGHLLRSLLGYHSPSRIKHLTSVILSYVQANMDKCFVMFDRIDIVACEVIVNHLASRYQAPVKQVSRTCQGNSNRLTEMLVQGILSSV